MFRTLASGVFMALALSAAPLAQTRPSADESRETERSRAVPRDSDTTPDVATAPAAPSDGLAREALIIANQDYATGVGPLANTHEDADLVKAALEGVGYRVRLVEEASRLEVLSEVRDYAARLASDGPGAIGIFYYTGHGAADEASGRNYLIPIDVTSTSSAALWDASVQVDEIQRRLSLGAPAANHFILFDACRNELRLPFRDASRGFVPQADLGGMFVSFSTAPGSRASDGDPSDPGGPYAQAFVEEIQRGGGRHATSFFEDVRFNVRDRTGGAQLPWQVNGLSDYVYPFGEASDAPPPPVTPSAPSAGGDTSADAEASLWAFVSNLNTVEGYRTYLEAYGSGSYAAEARARLAALQKSRPSPSVAAPETRQAPSDPAVANVQRILYELGYYAGDIDGLGGAGTDAAVAAFRRSLGFAPDTSVPYSAMADAMRQALAAGHHASQPSGSRQAAFPRAPASVDQARALVTGRWRISAGEGTVEFYPNGRMVTYEGSNLRAQAGDWYVQGVSGSHFSLASQQVNTSTRDDYDVEFVNADVLSIRVGPNEAYLLNRVR